LCLKFMTVAGPPSSGKTSVILQVAACLKDKKLKIGAVKFDCLASFDQYREAGIDTYVAGSGKVCPDHFFITNVQDAVDGTTRSRMRLKLPGALSFRKLPHMCWQPLEDDI
jgi:Ni2+-binding GTPase involved in maturation of urease and hydrogenase